MPDLDETAKSKEEIDVIDIEATYSDNDDMSVKSNDSKDNTSIMRKQLVENSASVINCSVDQIIKLVKCEEFEFVAKKKGSNMACQKTP